MTIHNRLTRRKFLGGASASALAMLALFSATEEAEARSLRGAPLSGSNFNGKLLQTNLSNASFSGGFPFLNALKGATGWSFNNGAQAPVTPDMLDANGNLNSAAGNAAGGLVTSFEIPSQIERPGNYINKWDGDGTCFFQSAIGLSTPLLSYSITAVSQVGTVVTFALATSPVEMVAGQPISTGGIGGGTWGGANNSWRVLAVNAEANQFTVDTGTAFTGTPTLSSATAQFQRNTNVANVAGGLNGSGRVAYSISNSAAGGVNQQFAFAVTSIQSTSNFPQNIVVCHVADEASLAAGQIYTTAFINALKNFGVIRFLNWQRANSSNITNWASRKPLSYVYYDSSELRANIYGGATSLSGSTYTLAAPSVNSMTGAAWNGTLSQGTTVSALFAQSTRQQSSITGSLSTSGVLTVNSVSSGFVTSGQYLLFSGAPVKNVTLIQKLTSTTWQTDFNPTVALSSVAMTTTQTWFTPLASFTNGSATINLTRAWVEPNTGVPETAVPNHYFQNGDLVNFDDQGMAVLPGNFTMGTNYVVLNAVAGVSIQLALQSSPTVPIVASGAGSGNIGANLALFMNVGGTGVLPILSKFAGPLTDGNSSFPVANTSQSLGTLVYDATLNAWLKFGSDGSDGPTGINNAVPFEAQVSLCNVVGAHMHAVCPYLAIDPATDFWPSLMLYWQQNALSGLMMRAEGPNECWNFVNTPSTQYGIAKTAVEFGSANASVHEWYGKILSVLGQIGAGVFGLENLNKTYAILGGVQTLFGNSAGNLSTHLPRFASGQYVSKGTVQSPLVGPWGTITFQAVPASPNSVTGPTATQWVSHLCCAQYITSSVVDVGNGPQTLDTLTSAFNGSQFLATIVDGVLDIQQVTAGVDPSVGDTVFGPGFANPFTSPVTIAGGTFPNFTLSSPITIIGSQFFISGTDMTAPVAEVTALVDTVVNATITGTNFVVNSIVSGNTVGQGLNVYGGTIAFTDGIAILNPGGGNFPNFTLNQSPGNQTANFNVGIQFSFSGAAQLYLNWATWVFDNFGVKIITGYEGNYSDDFGVPNNNHNTMTAMSKQAPALQAIVKNNLDNLRGIGSISYPAGVTGEFPAMFQFTGDWPINNAWSMWNDIYQSPVPPEVAAVLAYG